MKTKNYIKMCGKAEEIQKLCPFKEGDWFFNTSAIPDGRIFLNYKYQPDNESIRWELIYKKEERKDFNIWLPTQEQLQEMMMPILGKDFLGCAGLVLNRKLEECLFDNGIYNWGVSYNELWLAFVMKEKYNKTWDGKKWNKGE